MQALIQLLLLVISQIAHQQPTLVITPDSLTAQRLMEEIHFYMDKSLPLLHFPDWKTLPYDVFSPHQDIISERLTSCRVHFIRLMFWKKCIECTLHGSCHSRAGGNP